MSIFTKTRALATAAILSACGTHMPRPDSAASLPDDALVPYGKGLSDTETDRLNCDRFYVTSVRRGGPTDRFNSFSCTVNRTYPVDKQAKKEKGHFDLSRRLGETCYVLNERAANGGAALNDFQHAACDTINVVKPAEAKDDISQDRLMCDRDYVTYLSSGYITSPTYRDCENLRTLPVTMQKASEKKVFDLMAEGKKTCDAVYTGAITGKREINLTQINLCDEFQPLETSVAAKKACEKMTSTGIPLKLEQQMMICAVVGGNAP